MVALEIAAVLLRGAASARGFLLRVGSVAFAFWQSFDTNSHGLHAARLARRPTRGPRRCCGPLEQGTISPWQQANPCWIRTSSTLGHTMDAWRDGAVAWRLGLRPNTARGGSPLANQTLSRLHPKSTYIPKKHIKHREFSQVTRMYVDFRSCLRER